MGTLEQVFYIIGQALGGVAVLLGFISFQMKSTGRLLLLQLATALVFSVHYLLIGAPTAMALNLLAGAQCFFFFLRKKRGGKGIVIPILFTSLVVVTSLLTWEGWYSAFIMVGLVANSLALAFLDANRIRLVMFFKSPACIVYNAAVLSLGGLFYECAVLVSSVIGVLRHRAKKA